MKARTTILTLGPAFMAAALMASGPAAIAEDIPQIQGVTVTGTRIATVERPAGVVNQELTVKQTVNFSDLDLATESGERALEKRIGQAAGQVCDELERLLPMRTLDHGSCVREASDRALEDARTLARKAAPKAK